jgi:hypothetical protein
VRGPIGPGDPERELRSLAAAARAGVEVQPVYEWLLAPPDEA